MRPMNAHAKQSPPLLRWGLWILLGSLTLGCGYQFRTTGQPLGMTIDSIAIPMIESTASERGVEPDFTRIVRQEFISLAKVPLSSESEAQAVLTGRIYQIDAQPLGFEVRETDVNGDTANFSVTTSRRLTIWIDVKLTDRKTGKIIWHDSHMAEMSRYDVSVDPLVNRRNKQLALERIARLMARRMYQLTMDRF